ncbi:hypothetical protein pb186bvf_018699 [Paramecium bursaria]
MSKEDKLLDLVRQKEMFKPEKPKHLQMQVEDMDDFIDDQNEDKKYKKNTYVHYESDDEEAENNNKQNIKQYLQKSAVAVAKPKKGLNLDLKGSEIKVDIPIENVINYPVKNLEELKMAAYDVQIEPVQKIDVEDLDMDDIFNTMAKNEEKKSQTKQSQIKQLPPHRQQKLELSNTAPTNISTLKDDFYQRDPNKNLENIREKNGGILFYWMDIYEDSQNYPGELFLFGKVRNNKTGKFESLTVYLDDFPQTVYLLIDQGCSDETALAEVKPIVQKHLGHTQYTCQIVEKQFAFEIKEVPAQAKYVELKYSQRCRQKFPIKLNNPVLKAALQTTMTSIEQFIVYKSIKGPSWLIISQGKVIENGSDFRVSTNYTIQLNSDEDIKVQNENIPNPPLRVMSVSTKGSLNGKIEELVSISVVVADNIDQNGAEVEERYNYKSIIRMPNNEQWPIGFIKGKYIEVEKEQQLLTQFSDIVERIDPDMIVGHDLNQRIMAQLFNRFNRYSLNSWNRMARLQRIKRLPKQQFPAMRVMTIGRLMVDIYTQAKELVKSDDYSLKFLTQKYLNIQQFEVESDVAFKYFQTVENISHFVHYDQQDALYTLQIMQKLQIVSLTKQLTNICGNTWTRSLQNQRAERNEMLLMHEFFKKGYVLPDRKQKELEDEQAQPENDQKKKQKYAGGLVFEPEADLYTDFVLLLDFNSLYPSIIMEYNICFTNVQRTKPSLDNLNEDIQEIGKRSEDTVKGILPKVIENLVIKRQEAKKRMNTSQGLEKQIQNIRQLAIKLVANSMYGCLGFKFSRFYAVGIASLITSQGRNILMDSKATVELNHKVIYGDTDSMMIRPKLQAENTVWEVIKAGREIQKSINRKYKKLELGIDGIFESLLLLKKKKYAARKIANLDAVLNGETNVIYEREVKGIDLVRREFCKFSKIVQSITLDILLTKSDKGETFNNIYTLMEEVRNLVEFQRGHSQMTEEQIKNTHLYLKQPILISQMIITKQLSRLPNEYNDPQNHPHVIVAKRMIDNGREPASLVNHFIHYIICEQEGAKLLSDRAFTPEEVLDKRYNLQVDFNYYLQTQIFDPIERMCKHVKDLIFAKVAEKLGLNADKYKEKVQYMNKIEEKKQVSARVEYLRLLQVNCVKCQQPVDLVKLFDSENDKWKREYKCDNCDAQLEKSIMFKNRLRFLLKNLVDEFGKNQLECKPGFKTVFFSNADSCFGLCCEDSRRKKLKLKYSIGQINEQFQLLQQLIEPDVLEDKQKQNKKTIDQPYFSVHLEKLFSFLEIE